MKVNFANSLSRLAGAALGLAVLAWPGPAWGQEYLRITSNEVMPTSLSPGTYYGLLIDGNGHLTVNSSKINTRTHIMFPNNPGPDIP